MTPSPPPTPPTRLQEWILFYLLDRENSGRVTKGNDLFWPSDVEPLVDLGLVTLSQSHAVSSLQKTVSASTVISLTESGRHYFER
jgi:hypothetical protein